jgi:hypothetical protein
MTLAQARTVDDCIDTIEAAYEFMLAYAAQGRDGETGGATGPSVRHILNDLRAALNHLPDRLSAECGRMQISSPHFADFISLVADDCRRATIVVDLTLAVPSISSQLIDNLNASAHLRTVLTDVFMIDESLKSFRR